MNAQLQNQGLSLTLKLLVRPCPLLVRPAKDKDPKGSTLLRYRPANAANSSSRIDQDNGILLLKYGAQTLKLHPQTAKNLGWYDPPETLNMANSTA
jgi:hypothetical protein